MTGEPAGGAGAVPGHHVSPRFVLRPDWDPAPTRRGMLRSLAALWMLGLAGAWAAFILLNAIAKPAGFDSNIDEALDDLSAGAQLFLVVIFAPLIEETIYRLPLQRRLQLPLIVLSGVITALFFLSFWFVGLAVALVALLIWAVEPWRSGLERWWADHPAWPVWIFAWVFALTHLVNFEVDWSLAALLAVPFAVGPQLWLGLMFTIARIRYGFLAAVALHAAHNMTVWTVATSV